VRKVQTGCCRKRELDRLSKTRSQTPEAAAKVPPRYAYTAKDHMMTYAGNRQNWTLAFRHINGKSVDYVLCEKTTFKPVYAVELDDPTHNRTDRQERDREVERIFEGTDLKLVRFRSYSDLRERFL